MERLHRELMPQHLASRSVGMEELGVCNLIDGRHFFSAFDGVDPLPLWPDLCILTLTARLLPGDQESRDDDDDDPELRLQNLLQRVAEFACRMPKLQTLELYDATGDGAALFQYSVVDDTPSARWISTWEVEIGVDVKRAWESVPSPDGLCRTRFLPEKVVGDYKGATDFIATHLLTRGKIIEPETMRDQARLEESESDNAS
ncbi:F-box-like domain-containing protein [Apiospora phragmitis]|uniref:F-box-like domain-containing protein n=1 Tax=Apiospora phragmitis TaxID=2905665 RepID=A0ABR1UZY7_9PEZI